VSAGAAFEDAALKFLRQNGLSLLERNHAGRFGEIDLIMADCAATVFVEVRARTLSVFGDGTDSITASKRRKIVQTARGWLQLHPQRARGICRFDVVALDAEGATPPQWLKSAFS